MTVMRTISFRTILAGVAMVAIATVAAAQDRSALLTSIEVKRLAASSRSDDHLRLRDHFAALAEKYTSDANKHQATARVMTGNPNHPPAVTPGSRYLRLATSARETAATLRALSAHHGQLAARRPSTAPADSARFENGEGSPEPSDEQIRELIASARTPADHRNLAEYFDAVAEKQTTAANRYTAFAQGYRGQSRRTPGGDPAMHFDVLAVRSRDVANEARVEAARHRQLAQVG